MEMRVKPIVPYLLDPQIEAIADALLHRYEAQEGQIAIPPIPIEFIAEDFLGFTLIWEELADRDTLAFIDPNEGKICFNLARSDYFDHVGSGFTTAHEVGHSELNHFDDANLQLQLGLVDEPKRFLHREHQPSKYNRHEYQAEYFASCLVMPKNLLLPHVQHFDLLRWPSVYELAKLYSVSPTAMVKRLEGLNLIFKVGKKLYRSKEEAAGQQSLF